MLKLLFESVFVWVFGSLWLMWGVVLSVGCPECGRGCGGTCRGWSTRQLSGVNVLLDVLSTITKFVQGKQNQFPKKYWIEY